MLKNRNSTIVATAFFLSSLALFTGSSSAYANEITNYGFSSRGISMSGAVTGDVSDLSSVHYNPAGIGAAESEASLNLMFSLNLLHIDLYQRPEGGASVDVPADVYNLSSFPDTGGNGFPVATSDLANERKNTETQDFSTAMILGGTIALNKALKVAVAAFIPVQNPGTATFYPDGREQHFSNKLHFSIMDQKAPSPVIFIGTGVQPTDWLRIGATILMFKKHVDEVQLFLSNPTAELTSIHMQRASKSELGASFNAGLQIDLAKKFAVGVAYRHKYASEEEIVSIAEVYDYTTETPPAGPRFDQKNKFVHDFTPSELVLGLRFGNHCPWALNTDVVWRMWSQFDKKNDGTKGQEFHDIFIPRLGFEYEIRGWWDLRLGLEYAVNAVHDQDGETNHVDNDRISGSLGARFDLPWPENARLDLHFQFIGLIPRTYEKDDNKMVDEFPIMTNPETEAIIGDARLQTNNPGYPGYESGGLALSFGTAINVPF